jgi:heme iron utilization protein
MKTDAVFDPIRVTKRLLREGRTGALATLMQNTGDPYCSLVNVATDPSGAPIMLLSKLAVHTQNILADMRMSLMLDERKAGDPLEGARVMLIGTATADADPKIRHTYLRRHPGAEIFVGFSDFSFYKMEIKRAHLVAGFGRIVDLSPVNILINTSDAQALIEVEEEAIKHLNADHAETCRLYATRLLGGADGDWRCVGIDAEGIELQQGRAVLRLDFPQRVTRPTLLRAMLKQLAEKARAE